MASDISPANELFIQQAVARDGLKPCADVLNAAVALLREEEETLAAIREGLESIDRGEGKELAEVDARISPEIRISARSMNYRVIIQPRAWRDITEIVEYLAAHYSAAAVEAWYDGCIWAIDSLKSSPERCPGHGKASRSELTCGSCCIVDIAAYIASFS